MPLNKNISDEELVQLYALQKDTNALSILFERYKHLVTGVCLKYLCNIADAQDACMHIFEKLITDLPKQNIILFKAWIYTVSKNYCFMQLRKNNIKVEWKEDILPYDMENEDKMHLILEKEELLTKMENALPKLEDRQRVCIELFYLKKMSYTDIQSQTGFTFMEVKSFIQNGKRNLKLLMTNKIE